MKKDVTQLRKFLIERLGYARNQAGLSARELSQQLGFSTAYIAKFENGDFSIPAEVLLEAISICNMTPEEFFFHNITKYKDSNEMLMMYENLSDNSKQTIKELMKNLK